jgi:hypothetical protein
MKVRNALIALAATAALVLGGAGPALAGGSPHFIKSGTGASLSGTSLVVHFKEAGLSAGSTEAVEATAHLDATYQCVNGGGNVPADPKKTTISSEASASGFFPVEQNGNLVGTLTLNAPAAADALDCPGGQTATLTAAVYTNVQVIDHTSGATFAIRGTFSA